MDLNFSWTNSPAYKETLARFFDDVKSKHKELFKIELGIGLDHEGHKLKNRFLDPFFEDKELLEDLKILVFDYIHHDKGSRQLVQAFKQKIGDIKLYEQKLEKARIINPQYGQDYQSIIYEFSSIHSSIYGFVVGMKLGLVCFMYQGGIVGDSREFCKAHDGKVFTMDEANNFKSWKDSSGDIPSYFDYPEYNPFFHCGGFNCRHKFDWISNGLAIKLRPELKDILNK